MISIQERQRRWDRIRCLMKVAGYGLLLIAGREGAIGRGFIRYVTDWHLWGGNGYVLFPLEGEPVLILGSASQAMWAERIGWVKEVCVESPPIKGVVNYLKRGKTPSCLAIAGLNQFMPASDIEALREAIPSVHLIDATALMEKARVIKSAEEIGYLRETAEIVAEAMRRFAEVLRPGKTEREVVSEAWRMARRLGVLDGIAHISNESPPFIHPPTERVIAEDDVIKFSMEMAGPSGYWVELSAVFSFGEPPPDQLREFETTLRAVRRIANLLRPGVVGNELVKAVERTFREDGWEDTSRVIWDAHGIGLDVIESPVIVGGDSTILEEGMAINVHPGLVCGANRMGAYIQDNYIVSPGGGQPLSGWNHQWHILK